MALGTILFDSIASREISSSCPSSAFVAGVIIGSGNLSFSFMPSGIVTPQSTLFPSLYSLAACPAKYPLMTISTRIGSHAIPTATFASGVASSQFGTISSVAFKNIVAT